MQNLHVKEYLMRPWVFRIGSPLEKTDGDGITFENCCVASLRGRQDAKPRRGWKVRERSVCSRREIPLACFSLYFHQHWILGLWRAFVCEALNNGLAKQVSFKQSRCWKIPRSESFLLHCCKQETSTLNLIKQILEKYLLLQVKKISEKIIQRGELTERYCKRFTGRCTRKKKISS